MFYFVHEQKQVEGCVAVCRTMTIHDTKRISPNKPPPRVTQPLSCPPMIYNPANQTEVTCMCNKYSVRGLLTHRIHNTYAQMEAPLTPGILSVVLQALE